MHIEQTSRERLALRAYMDRLALRERLEPAPAGLRDMKSLAASAGEDERRAAGIVGWLAISLLGGLLGGAAALWWSGDIPAAVAAQPAVVAECAR